MVKNFLCVALNAPKAESVPRLHPARPQPHALAVSAAISLLCDKNAAKKDRSFL